jgi:hypothetical protein
MGAIALLGLLCACDKPEARVYALQTAYTAAMEPAADYVELPRCGTVAARPPLCSDPATVDRIQDAVRIASPAMRGAQAAVRADPEARAVWPFLDAAQAALAALIAATPEKPDGT